jgi:predicted RNA-binding protein YlqC (UPF0109 family)
MFIGTCEILLGGSLMKQLTVAQREYCECLLEAARKNDNLVMERLRVLSRHVDVEKHISHNGRLIDTVKHVLGRVDKLKPVANRREALKRIERAAEKKDVAFAALQKAQDAADTAAREFEDARLAIVVRGQIMDEMLLFANDSLLVREIIDHLLASIGIDCKS